MGQVNGREPEPLGTRGLAEKLQVLVDAKLLEFCNLNLVYRSSLSPYEHTKALSKAAGELMETELRALAIEWSKRFHELEKKVEAMR